MNERTDRAKSTTPGRAGRRRLGAKSGSSEARRAEGEHETTGAAGTLGGPGRLTPDLRPRGSGTGWLVAKVVAAGVLWFIVGVVLLDALHGHARAEVATLITGAALSLTAPLLHTRRAGDLFAPVRFRNTFLAGATGAVTCAVLAALCVLESARAGWVVAEVGFLAVVLGLLGAAFGVVRMRAWGVALAALTSAVLLAGCAVKPEWWDLLLLLATPGAALTLPVVLARLGLSRDDPGGTATLRVASLPLPVQTAFRTTRGALSLEESPEHAGPLECVDASARASASTQ